MLERNLYIELGTEQLILPCHAAITMDMTLTDGRASFLAGPESSQHVDDEADAIFTFATFHEVLSEPVPL